jgi:hypothetical protein
MGLSSRATAYSILTRFTVVAALAIMFGCQALPPALTDRSANIDPSGLTPDFTVAELNVRAAIPRGWQSMSVDTSALYTHEQWRSPRHNTGVGVVYAHLPLPMSAKALVWLARTQYSRQSASEHSPDANVLGEWTDALGREWFEGENTKYHVKGYVVTNGLDAWAVYSGYRLRTPPTKRDLNLAFRSMESIMPLPLSVLADAK